MNDIQSLVAQKLNNRTHGDSTLAVAVSGGADSMALVLLAQATGKKVIAITVDHQLRESSRKEAEQVGEWLSARGIEHHILTWEHAPLMSAIEERAREARYKLLTLFCHRHNIKHLLVGHHLQDQAETFLLRLTANSEADGLACMSSVSERDGIFIHRPLLQTPKSELLNYLRSRGQPWCEDETNADLNYSRNRVRSLFPALAEQGITAEKLAESAKQYGELRRATDEMLQFVATETIEISDMGYAWVKLNSLRRCPPALAARLVSRLVRTLGGITAPPRTAEIERLSKEICETSFAGATLGGCEFMLMSGKKSGHLLVMREWARTETAACSENSIIRWDGRYLAKTNSFTQREVEKVTIGALGADGLKAILNSSKLPNVPRKALYALPAVRHLDKILSVPHIHYGKAEIASLSFVPRQAFPPAPFAL